MPLSDAVLYDKIRRTVTNKHELQVLESFLIFNKCAPVPLLAARIRIAVTDECVCVRVHRNVLKTNFYQPTKVALSFRLAPDFLPEVEYPKKPFGMFFVIGNEFRGFHIRFRDVARGGIRIVQSRNRECVPPFFRSLLQRLMREQGVFDQPEAAVSKFPRLW